MTKKIFATFSKFSVFFLSIASILLLMSQSAPAQTTEIIFQGQLQSSSAPANGNFDFEFRLFDALTGGAQIGPTLSKNNLAVANGTFSVQLDFGANFPGADRFLEIHVRQTGGGAFTPLTPRQQVTSAPYSIKSLTADGAINAANADNLSGACVGCVTNSQINSVDGGKVTGTVTNATSSVHSTNFAGNLAGDVTGTQSATVVTKVGGQAASNVANAAQAVTTATSNNTASTLVKRDASGNFNAGTITGNLAGNASTATNAANAATSINATNAVNATNATNAVNFSGALGGDVTGTQSATTVAKLRDVSLPAPVVADNGKVLKYKNNGIDPITYEWATDNIGGGGGDGGVASVTASGPLASSGGATPNISLTGVVQPANGGTGLSSSGSAGNFLRSNGTAFTSAALTAGDIPSGSTNYIQNQNAVAQATSNFNISGTGTANIINAATQYNIGGNRVLSVAGANNLYAGVGAGVSNQTGNGNTLVGREAGASNLRGSGNSFFGYQAGFTNLGDGGDGNSFFGASAGRANMTGRGNSFFGQSAGQINTGSDNTFVGTEAGRSQTTGNANTTLGARADIGASNLSFATAIGAFAGVTQSNSLVLGAINGTNGATADTKVGIGTTAPSERLHVVGNGLITGNLAVTGNITGTLPAGSASYIQNQNAAVQPTSNFNISGSGTAGGTLSGNAVNSATQYNVGGNRLLSVDGPANLFAGFEAGVAVTTGGNNAFFGGDAGPNNTRGSDNSFFGNQAGFSNREGHGNSFFGRGAGRNSTGLANSFFGYNAGTGNTGGVNNTIIGYSANVGSNSLTYATAIGAQAQVSQSNSLVLGSINGTNGATADTKVGIGTTAPSERLHVVGNGLITGNLAVTGGLTVDTTTLFVDAVNNRVGVGVTAPANLLHVSGAGTTAGGCCGPTPTASEVVGHFFQSSTGAHSAISIDSTTDRDSTLYFAENGGAVWGLRNDGDAGDRFQLRYHGGGVGDDSASRLTVLTGGNVGLGTSTPNDKLEVNGIIRVTTLGVAGATALCRNASNQISTCSSSMRYKQNVNPFVSGLSLIKQLQPVSFSWRANNQADLGLVAEDVAKAEPLLTTINDKGEVEGVKYDRVGVVLINAIKEQQSQIDVLERRNESQQKQIQLLTKVVCSLNLKAEICVQK